ncbi:Uncharacterised protein [uncultured archaeon]|nr:Uncharacterised protein [uncultured archaeon]
MPGLDTLIAKSLDLTIKENLGKKTLEKVEQRLFEKYGINLTQSIADFTKLDTVLREFFGKGAEVLEKQFLENIVTLEETKNNEPNWVAIDDPSLARQILEAFGDDDKNKILNAVLDEFRTISDILKITKLPQTSGYRKINSLIDGGLLINQGRLTIQDGKKVNKYKSIIENLTINLKKNRVIVKALLAEESIRRSSIIKCVRVSSIECFNQRH